MGKMYEMKQGNTPENYRTSEHFIAKLLSIGKGNLGIMVHYTGPCYFSNGDSESTVFYYSVLDISVVNL